MDPKNNNPELHVIFGSGPLGKWTARTLVEMGQRVRIVNRSGRAGGLPAGVEVVRGDAYDGENNKALTRGAAAVYQCAQPAYHQWAQAFPPLQTAILEAAAANGARLIAAENLYMYGDVHGQPLREDLPYRAQTRKGKVRQAMTEALFAAHRAGKVQAATARGSDFFGPDEPGIGERVFLAALNGKTVNLLGSLDQPHTFTYTPDFGRLLATLGTRGEALGQAWHVPSEAPVTQRQLVKLVEEACGRPVKAAATPALMLRALGLFNPLLAELPEMMYEWTQPFVMDSSKAQQAFGLKPTPLREQVGATLQWVKANLAVKVQ